MKIRVFCLACGLFSSGHALYNYFINDISTGLVNSLILCTAIAISDVVFED
jgi:hypothetical protein